MPEINPLTNNQIFLKKIAENTGSDYDTGDVSEINPLTIDQILLKEIAANTAGQSGDISELEAKVADNTAAISAMVNVNGACNALPIDLASSDIIDGVTFTVTSDGIVVSGTATADIDYPLHSNSPVLNKDVNYKLTGCPTGGSSDTYYLQVGLWNSSTFIDGYRDYGNGNLFNSENNTGISGDIIIKSGTAITTPIIFKPMLYDARLNPSGYVPYAMTNRELTDRIKIQQISVTTQIDGTCQLWHSSVMMMPIGFSVVTFPSYANEVNGSFTLSTNGYWYMMMKKSDGSIIAEKTAVIIIAYLSY